jgi:putative oxidoreductase
MKKYQQAGTLLLRITMAATFLSAVASRLNWWGKESSGWNSFLSYTAEVLSFAPARLIPLFAVSATVLETAFGLLLIIGYKTKWVAMGAAFLTFSFALSMACSSGIKSPLDYSVFVDCTACFLLATFPCYRWSIDKWLSKK